MIKRPRNELLVHYITGSRGVFALVDERNTNREWMLSLLFTVTALKAAPHFENAKAFPWMASEHYHAPRHIPLSVRSLHKYVPCDPCALDLSRPYGSAVERVCAVIARSAECGAVRGNAHSPSKETPWHS